MQILLTVILIAVSIGYLFLKWMPMSNQGKDRLQAWLLKHAPALQSYIFFNSKDCSSGCSTCGACAEPTDKTTKEDQTRIIRIIPNR